MVLRTIGHAIGVIWCYELKQNQYILKIGLIDMKCFRKVYWNTPNLNGLESAEF